MFKRKRVPRHLILADTGSRPPRRSPLGRLLLVAALMLAGTLLFWQVARALPHSETPRDALDAVGAGQLLVRADGGSYRAAAMVDSRVHFDITGLVVSVQLEQTFRNHSSDWVEALYAFPLPERAAVHRMRLTVGERVIEGKLREREQARRDYQQARAAGKRAGLVEQQRPNLFTTAVANIGPGETVRVSVEYLDTATYDSGVFSLRFPMTITPRYIPGRPLGLERDSGLVPDPVVGWALATDQVPDAKAVTPFLNPTPAGEAALINPITITADLRAGLPLADVASAHHPLLTRRDDEHYQLQLAAGRVSMDRDFVLSWRPVVGAEPEAALFSEELDGETYLLLMMLPPQALAAPDTLPRELIFVVDSSGSMGGASIEQARQSLLSGLDQLGPQDRFNIIEFNNATRVLFPHPVAAKAATLERARRFVRGLQAGGGTEMAPALAAALDRERESAHLRQIVFITDGAVGNEAALFELIHRRLGTSRLFTVGIGAAPNSYFMRRAAELGRGSFTHIGAIDRVAASMSALFTRLASPVAADIEVEWPAGTRVAAIPDPVPDLYRGEPLLLAAKSEALPQTVVINGRTAGTDWQRELQLTGAGGKGIATLWARRKIAALLSERHRGRSEKEVRAAVLPLALRHSLVSPYTSFVAVEQQPARPVDAPLQRTAVPNARPHGQSPQPYAYPATATRAQRSLLLGASLLLLALLWLACISRRSPTAAARRLV